MAEKSLQDLCLEYGLLDRQALEYLEELLEKEVNVSFEELVLRQYPQKEEDFVKICSKYYNLPYLSAAKVKQLAIDTKTLAASRLSIQQWKETLAFPSKVRVKDSKTPQSIFVIANRDKADVLSAVEVARKTEFKRFLGPPSAILDKLIEYENSLEKDKLSEKVQQLTDPEKAVDFVMALIEYAVRLGASDIHFDPTYDQSVEVFFRVDGLLTPIRTYNEAFHSNVVNAIFSRAEIKISDFIHLHDGQMEVDLKESLGREVSLRVSSIPMAHGQPSVVLRVLDSKKALPSSVEELGYSSYNVRRLTRLYKKPYGIIFITGPTGSGKTTTLYTVLNIINEVEHKVVTIEDPVEYYVRGVVQCKTNLEAEVTFARVVKGFLRHDPDIILIGEIRDSETATVAVQAAQTGHLVFSTLHTNTSIESVIRLKNIGVQSYDIGDALLGVCAQRLLRKACPYCSEVKEAPEKLKKYHVNEILVPKKNKLGKNVGCPQCGYSGYSGRTLVSEVFASNPEIKMALFDGAPPAELRKLSLKYGFASLERDALGLLRRRVTTLEEVERVLGDIFEMLAFEDKILRSYGLNPYVFPKIQKVKKAG